MDWGGPLWDDVRSYCYWTFPLFCIDNNVSFRCFSLLSFVFFFLGGGVQDEVNFLCSWLAIVRFNFLLYREDDDCCWVRSTNGTEICSSQFNQKYVTITLIMRTALLCLSDRFLTIIWLFRQSPDLRSFRMSQRIYGE